MYDDDDDDEWGYVPVYDGDDDEWEYVPDPKLDRLFARETPFGKPVTVDTVTRDVVDSTETWFWDLWRSN